MGFIRSCVFLLFQIVLTTLYGTACMVLFPFLSPVRRYWFAIGWCRIMLVGFDKLCGVRCTVLGRENLPDSPAIVLAKHQSAWETIALPAIMPHPLCYVFKRELLYVPFVGWTLRMLRMIHIDRKDGVNAFQSVVRQGKEKLAEGAWIIMFPEGTRTPTGSHRKYKSGGARLAVETQTQVIPVAHNAGRVWPRNSFLKYPGQVTVSIGPPIPVNGLTPDEVNGKVEAWIEAEMRRIDPLAYR